MTAGLTILRVVVCYCGSAATGPRVITLAVQWTTAWSSSGLVPTTNPRSCRDTCRSRFSAAFTRDEMLSVGGSAP